MHQISLKKLLDTNFVHPSFNNIFCLGKFSFRPVEGSLILKKQIFLYYISDIDELDI